MEDGFSMDGVEGQFLDDSSALHSLCSLIVRLFQRSIVSQCCH